MAVRARRGGCRKETTISNQHNKTRSKSGFRTFLLGSDIQRGIAAAGFTEPRPIQAKTIPAVLAGRDVLGLAQTGTGKTAAFVLPILERLSARRSSGNRDARGPRALVVAPTRELALQIQAELVRLAAFTRHRSTTVFGGVSVGAQIRELRRNPDVVVACPGRLLDLWKQKKIDLRSVEILVLDEADHMFDMGFLPDIKRILNALPPRRQNLLFAATMPREIRALTDRLLERPHVVELNHSCPASTIEHALYPVADRNKIALLTKLLDEDEFTSGIVFLRTKHRAKRLAMKLDRMGHNAVALQGNMSQPQRDRAMTGFRKGMYDVLVATDIAARGIDVAGLSHVINFDLPNTPDAYTHRIGRTGRAERNGKACTFVTRDDAEGVRAIERRIGASIRRIVTPGFEGERVAAGSGGGGAVRPISRNGRGAGRRGSAGTSRPRRGTTLRARPASSSSESRTGERRHSGGTTFGMGIGLAKKRVSKGRRRRLRARSRYAS